jgi:hypothetical protein
MQCRLSSANQTVAVNVSAKAEDEERDLYDSAAAGDFRNRNRKPKGAKPWQFRE